MESKKLTAASLQIVMMIVVICVFVDCDGGRILAGYHIFHNNVCPVHQKIQII